MIKLCSIDLRNRQQLGKKNLGALETLVKECMMTSLKAYGNSLITFLNDVHILRNSCQLQSYFLRNAIFCYFPNLIQIVRYFTFQLLSIF